MIKNAQSSIYEENIFLSVEKNMAQKSLVLKTFVLFILFILAFVGGALVSPIIQSFLNPVSGNTGLMILRGHSLEVNAIAISPDEKKLISGGEDEKIKIWDLTTGKLLYDIDNQSPVKALAITHDGKSFMSGDTDQKVKIWDLETQKLQNTLSEHKGTITSLAISANGKILASGSEDKTIKIWDLKTGKSQRNLKENKTEITSLMITPDNDSVISGSIDGELKKWSLSNGKVLSNDKILAIKTGVSIVIDPERKKLLTSACNPRIDIRDLKKIDQIERLADPDNNGICHIALNYKQDILAADTIKGKIKLWDLNKNEIKCHLSADESRINDIMFSKSGKLLAFASEDKTIKIWSVNNLTCLQP